MSRSSGILLIAASLLFTAPFAGSDEAHSTGRADPVQSSLPAARAVSLHGAPITLKTPTRLTDAITAAAAGDAAPRLFAGTIREVCRQKGCWLILADPASPAIEPVRVTFADYAFFVPKDVAGRDVRLQGVLRQKKVSVKDAQHYAKDAGRPKGEIAAIRTPQVAWTIEATGVEIR
jgi:hypothetical protein